MDDKPQSSAEPQQTPSPQPGISGWAVFVFSSGISSLIALFMSSRVDTYEMAGIEAVTLIPVLSLCLFIVLIIQAVSLIAGLIYLCFRFPRNRRATMITLTGVICSMVFVILLFLPNYLEARERKRLPERYETWFPWVTGALASYRKHHGEYPPALMPYLVPRFWEHVSAFPPDAYHKPEIQRYWHTNDGTNQWLDHDKPMKGEFDFTGYYRYYTDCKGYILIGNAPDYDADLDAKESFLAARRGDKKKLIENKYDPTNGTKSGGDYWVLKLK